MRTPKGIPATAFFLVGFLALAGTAASAATATSRASARIVAPAKVAVTPEAGWSASVHSRAEGRVLETSLRFAIDRPRDYSVGIRLEKNDTPFGTTETSWSESRRANRGFTSATRLRVELPEGEGDSKLDRSHVRIVLHNH